MEKILLRKDEYDKIIDMMIHSELLVIKKEILIGTRYPKKVIRYWFRIDGVDREVKTSQTKDKVLLYARRNNLIF